MVESEDISAHLSGKVGERNGKDSRLEAPVIVSKLPPSWFFGAFATVIHTEAFNCFVSTARIPLLWSRWTTRIYSGDPAVDRWQIKPCCTFLFSASLSKSEVHEVHDVLSQKIDFMGERGSVLIDAVALALKELYQQGVIEKVLQSEKWIPLPLPRPPLPSPDPGIIRKEKLP